MAPKAWGAHSLGPGNSRGGFGLLSGNFLLCSDVRGMRESLLGITHYLVLREILTFSIPFSACTEVNPARLRLTWPISHKNVAPTSVLGVGQRQHSSSVPAPLALRPVLWAAHKSTAPFSFLGPGPLLSGALFQKHHQPRRWFSLHHSSYSWQILHLHINTPWCFQPETFPDTLA